MRRRLQLVVLLSVLAWIGGWATGQVHSTRDKAKVATMTEKIKTVCVGRYVVDVPAQAEVSFSGSILDGFELVTVEESETAFRRRVAAREAAIEASQADPAIKTEGRMVEAHDLRNAGMVGRTFLSGRSRGYLKNGDRRVYSESVSVESDAHIGGVSVSLSADTTQESRVAEEDKRKINGVDGEEALLRAREYNLIKTYGFNWEAHGTPGDPALPYLSLKLRTGISARPDGKPVDTSLHEDALLALRDRIASSIRLRNPDKASPRPNSSSADPRQPVAP